MSTSARLLGVTSIFLDSRLDIGDVEISVSKEVLYIVVVMFAMHVHEAAECGV